MLFLHAPAGSGCPPHEHDTETATVIISGGMILIAEDGEEQRFGPGDWYQTNPGQTHAIRFGAPAQWPARRGAMVDLPVHDEARVIAAI